MTTPVLIARPAKGTVTALSGMWIDTTATDTDPYGDMLAVTAIGLSGTKGSPHLVAGATSGVYYSPGSAFAYLSAGETALDTFSYTVTDAHGLSATATVTVTVTGVNQPPVARADLFTATASGSAMINPLANDTDPNRDDVLTVTGLNTAGTLGKATLGANNTVLYTPGTAFQYLASGKTATDRFSYTISDGHGGVATATDTATVVGTWKPPTAVAESARTDAAHSTVINVLASDTDPQANAALSVVSLNLASTDGSAVVNTDGTVTYTPGPAFQTLVAGTTSTDSFGYTVQDQSGQTSSSTVTVTVSAPGTAAGSGTPALYVSTSGNDAWSGRLAQPNAAGTDGPLASLQAAQKRMEASAGTTKTTYVEGGNYDLSQQISLTSADSGQSWLAYPGEAPVIHGGQAVTGWVQGGNGIWTAKVPASAFPSGGGVADLFVNGVRETHARYPNSVPSNPVGGGWLFAAASLPGEATTSSFQFSPGDLPSLGSASGLYVDVYQQDGWQNFVLPVSSINTATDTITLAGQTATPIGAGSRYYIFNAASQLDAQNEWFYNPANGTISLYAPAGFNGSGVTVGSLSNDMTLSSANNVTIEGLTFADTSSSGNGIYVGNSSGDNLVGDAFQNDGNAVTFSGNSANDTLQGSTIRDADNDGVLITPGTSFIKVVGDTIHDIGESRTGNAIRFTGSSNDTFSQNRITAVAGSGISGGSVNSSSDASYHDTITHNDIENTNLQTSDGGAIYLDGRQQDLTGDVVDYNRISGTGAAGTSPAMAFLPTSQLVSYGIYLDDFLSGAEVKGNLLTGNVGGIQVHSGWSDTVSGNVVVGSSGNALINTVSNSQAVGKQPDTSNLFTGNLISDPVPGAKLASNLGDLNGSEWKGNFYDATGVNNQSFLTFQNGKYVPESFATWQAQGFDAGSITGNFGPAGTAASGYMLPASLVATASGTTTGLSS